MRSSVLAIALFAVAAPARADVLDVRVTTLLAGRQDPRDGRVYTVVPAYELLTLQLDQIQTRYVHDLKVVVSAWGEIAFGEARDGRVTGDVDLGFIEGKLFDRRLTLRAGRQLVWAGGARVFQLDGGSLRWRVVKRLYLDVWGGAPVTPRFGVRLGDAAVGGRASWRHGLDTEVGVSFLHVLDAGRIARQDLGADARYAPARQVAFTGYLLYALTEQRIAEADVGVTLQPHPIFDLRVDYRRTAPDLFLPRSSILSVFADESRDEAGGAFYLRPLARLSLDGDYALVHDDAGYGHRGGGRVSLRLGPAFQTTVGAEGRLLRLVGNGYTQARLFALSRLTPSFSIALDLDAYLLEQPVNGATFSLTGAATLAWDFAPSWRATVTGLADSTPLVEHRFEVLAKLIYQHTWHWREVHK